MMKSRNSWKMRLAAALVVAAIAPAGLWAQPAKRVPSAPPAVAPLASEAPDAEQVRNALRELLDRYPPNVKNALSVDPTLVGNAAYLAPYPALVAFLNAHPEVVNSPSYYTHRNADYFEPPNRDQQIMNMWRDTMQFLAVITGFGMAIGLLVWLIRTFIEQRRWSRLTKIQTEVHTKLIYRIGTNEDMIGYVQSPAGAKFLESSPIQLEPASKNTPAPLGRILLSGQGGVVLVVLGIGLEVVSARVPEIAQPVNVMGILAIALGVGFVLSAIISYGISQRLGLIDRPKKNEEPGA
jgi:hypothetical protein